MPAEQTIHLEKYSPEARALVASAQSLADERKHAQVEPVHLLARALDRDRGSADVFRKAGAEPADVAVEAEAALGRIAKSSGALAYLSNAMLDLLARAEKEAAGGAVGVEQLLNALSQEIRGSAAIVLQAFALGPGSLRPHMSALRNATREVAAASTTAAGQASPFVRDLIARSKDGTYIGREVEVRRLQQILERRQKNHPLLVGEAGVGKQSIIGALASQIAAREVPDNLADMAIVELEIGSLVAGAKLRGEVEERLKQALAQLKSAPGGRETILYINGIESLFGQGSVGSGVGDLLRPMLARGDVRMLATTSPEGLRKLQEKDAGLLRHFTILTIDPPSADLAIEILRGIATRYEEHHHVRIGDPAIVASVRLAKRYIQDRALPDSAVDLLDEAAARKRVEIDGVPAAVDTAIRRLSSLKAQRASVTGDDDAMSRKTRERIDAEIAALAPKVNDMRAKMDAQRSLSRALSAARAALSEVQKNIDIAREKKDFARLGELEHKALPDATALLEKSSAAFSTADLAEQNNIVGEQDVATVLGDWTGIPVAKMLESEAEKLLKMEERLGKRVVGQNEAVRAVSRAVRRGRVGLRDPGKPIGSFLFLGPSGVGKTELAKALAEFLFDDEQSLTRLDMSEFMEKHMAQRLVGAPPGYVDSEEGGFLTEAVRRKPYSVLLFDEVEKAHADVFNLMLQVLDDGRLTDGRGRLADFSNTVVIMTSNIGSQRILDADIKMFDTEEGCEAMREVLRDELKTFLRPEFLNRIDDVVVFRPLTKRDLRGIVDIQLKRLGKLVADRELSLELSEAAKMALVDMSYEPGFGARPLKRSILKKLQDPLAEEILAGGYAAGAVVKVDVSGETFVFSKG